MVHGVAGGAVTELATQVASPAPDRAAGIDGTGVGGPTADRLDAGQEATAVSDLDRLRADVMDGVAGRSISELPRAIIPPAPDRAAHLERAHMELSDGDGLDVGENARALIDPDGSKAAMIFTGSPVVPSPTWPSSASPQHHTVPFDFKAHE